MTQYENIYGKDVSKSTLDISVLNSDTNEISHRHQIENALPSIANWLAKTACSSSLYILEPTGSYSSKVLHQLCEQDCSVSLIPPYQSKSFVQAMGISNKSDQQAADCLAQMGQAFKLKLFQAPSQAMQERKHLLRTISSLKKQERRLLNQLYAMDQLVILHEGAKEATQQILNTVQEQLQQLQNELAQQRLEPEYQHKKQFATSVVGIGESTADTLLLATNCFEGFDSSAKVAKFLGLTPVSHYSGSSVAKKGGITKFGDHHVRSALFNCVRAAVRFNPQCKELFERLRREGKPYKVAAVAVMHKLVKQVYACVTKETLYQKDYKQFNEKKSE